MTEEMNVPKLRFSEFEGFWSRKSISEVATKVTDGTHDTPKPTSSGVPYVTAIHVKDGFIDFDNCYYVSTEVHEVIYKRCNPEKGDLLIVNIGAGTATCAINTVEYEFSMKNVALVKPDRDIAEPYFLEQVQRKETAKLFHKLTSGGAQPFFSLKEIKKLTHYYPALPEQQKIASFLSKVDEKIALLTEKKDKLTEYKKGVMQQLFNGKWEVQDGQLNFIPPTLRFKADDGSEFPDWEEVKLGDFTKPVKRKATDTVSKVMTISASQGFLDQKERFSQVIAGSSLDRYTHIKKGEFSYNRGNSKTFKYGCIYMMREDEALVPFVYRTFKLTSGIPEFYQQLFLNHVLDRQLRKMISSSARMDGLLNIGEKDFYKVKLLVPSIGEQKKIANFLSAIDQKIDLANSELEKAKEWKKGLLQQMFV
ncbi:MULTISPECIES: restriction endonuclease subunit S [Vibrio]|uniref:restriction endonuclease subunit S n=1 Tax=Vibrio TaxID=662 RepID=UPI000813A62C|nr:MULTISPECIES: restriction endonuclease subunit S [Vibrio]EGR2700291.1 restriction endonuclease subunit S [Vibrio parahaemolyticus]OCP42322.1 type I restriction-modification enzyme S subunit [Vibrio parahaemolyticus]OCP44057.1 type I restriction-modification enzyme S subunit [Vibrio parahaemolyticus]URQ94610.1 restriction endonuclease subunit S [Vibrio sp. SCSIO 43097]